MKKRDCKRQEEWEVLQELENNPNIVTPLDVFETDDDIQLVLEYCDSGDLFDAIQRHKADAEAAGEGYKFPEDQASLIVSQVLSALADLHTRGIAHRDVKPENILLKTEDDGIYVKLSDFGTAKSLHHAASDDEDSDGESSPFTPQSRMRAYSTVGSTYYGAPEVWSGEGYGSRVDMYSLGVTLYVLLLGTPPSFTYDESGESFVQFPDSCRSKLSYEAKDLIRKMLNPNPLERISAEEALQDPWIVTPSDYSQLLLADGRFWSGQEAVPQVDSLMDLDLSEQRRRKRVTMSHQGPTKRSRTEDQDEASTLIAAALEKLYKGVAAAAQSATDAAAGVVLDDLCQDVRIHVDDRDDNSCVSVRSSLSDLSLPALSV